MSVALPAPLRPWAPWLGHLAPKVALAVGPVVRRLDLAIGPMAARHQPGAEHPDGIGGLTRRGSYERLLLSEWALADTHPDEFLRRASQGEHLFLDLEKLAPLGGRRTVLLLDGGPDLLGAPRLLALAVLVVLARRAAEADATLTWGVLQEDPATLREGLDADGIRAWSGTTSLADPTVEDLTAWHEALGPDGTGEERWILGGPVLDALVTASLYVVPDDDLDGDHLAVEVRPPGGGPARSLRLPLPDPATAVALLRRPTAAATHAEAPVPRRREHRDARLCPIVAHLRFSDGGHRLMGTLASGAIGAWKIPSAHDRRLGRPWVATTPDQLPEGGWHPLAFTWHKQRLHVLGRAEAPETPLRLLQASGWWKRVTGAGARPGAPDPDQAPGQLLLQPRWRKSDTRIWVRAPDDSLWVGIVNDAAPLRPPPGDDFGPGSVLHLGHREGHRLLAWASGSVLQVTVGEAEDDGQERHVIRDLWEGPGPRLAVGPTGAPWNTGLIMYRRLDGGWVLVASGHRADVPAPPPVQVPPGEEVVGATRVADHRPALLCRDPVERSLRLRLVDGQVRALPHDGPVTHAATSPGRRYVIAWRCEDGRITTWDLHEDERLVTFLPRSEEDAP